MRELLEQIRTLIQQADGRVSGGFRPAAPLPDRWRRRRGTFVTRWPLLLKQRSGSVATFLPTTHCGLDQKWLA